MISVLATCAMTMVSCQDPVQQIAGNYSYKISGAVYLDSDKVELTNEIGAMEIVHIDDSNALVTFNALIGDVYATQARISGKRIVLQPYRRDMTVKQKDCVVTAEGEGMIYDATILFSLQYTDTVNKLTTDTLVMLCKKN